MDSMELLDPNVNIDTSRRTAGYFIDIASPDLSPSIPRSSKRKNGHFSKTSEAKRSRSDPSSECHSLYSSATLVGLFSDHNSGYSQSNDQTSEGNADEGGSDVLSQQLECLRTTVHDLINGWRTSNNRMRVILDANKDAIAMANEILEKSGEIRATTLSLPGESILPTACNSRFKQIAKEIIRCSKVDNGTEESQYLNNNPSLEFKMIISLYYLMAITQGGIRAHSNTGAAIRLVQPILLEERKKVYLTILAELSIAELSPDLATRVQYKIKQELITFFDRCFTYQVASIYRREVRLHAERLLHLGGDDTFNSADGLVTGGEDSRQLEERNQTMWTYLMKRSTLMSPLVSAPASGMESDALRLGSKIYHAKEDKQKQLIGDGTSSPRLTKPPPIKGTCTSNLVLSKLYRERERTGSTDSNASSQSACLYGRSGRRPSISGMTSGSEANWKSEWDTKLRGRFTDMGLQKKKKGLVHMVREIGGVLVEDDSVDEDSDEDLDPDAPVHEISIDEDLMIVDDEMGCR